MAKRKKQASRDWGAIEAHLEKLFQLIGLDLTQPDLVHTPRRVARMYKEIFSGHFAGQEPKITVFPNEKKYTSMVVLRDIPFYSVCAHHLIPFFGVGHIAYLPAERIAGLSKLARGLEFYARRPQVQERLTEQVADFLNRTLEPRGMMVVLEARHLCMEMRGVEKPGSLTVTSTMRGLFEDSMEGGRYRMEFMNHIGRAGSVPR